jgi:hypothetical protein
MKPCVQIIVALGVAMSPLTLSAVANNALNAPDSVKAVERLLQLARPELEKMASTFTADQKLALKKVAFNRDSDLQVRWRALVLAARLLGPEMRSDIKNAAKSSDWFMRSASMMAANELSIDEAAILARKLISDKALVVRSAAVDILGASGDLVDRQILWKIIRDPINVRKGQSLWIRSQALQILARKPLRHEIANFILLLNESDLELQAISIHGLETASNFQFGSSHESIEEHRKRWLNWWEVSGKTKNL